MKIRLNPFIATLCLMGLVATPAFALSSEKKGSERKGIDTVQIDSLSSQTKMLMAQVNRLQKEVKSLQYQQKTTGNMSKKSVSGSNQARHSNPTPRLQKDVVGHTPDSLEENVLPFDPDQPGQAFVATGPYVGVPIQYTGSDLIINSPSVNTDVQLLGIRKTLLKKLHQMNPDLGEIAHTHLLVSGVVEGEALYTRVGGGANTSDFDVTNASLDSFFIGPSDWTLGFLELTYDNGLPSGSGYRTSNSRIYVNKAFITIGDLAVSPFYGTFGQYYVPFGTYSSLMVSDVLTKLLARTKERALTLGFQEQSEENAFYGSVYGFRGDSRITNSSSRLNNGGVNVGYKFKQANMHGDIGGGVIGNLADSGGMQSSNGFSADEQITHRVPAYDLRATLNLLDHFDFIGEYVGASTRFNPNDMGFNGHGAKPWAFDSQLAYSFYVLNDKPSSVGIGYARTHEALSLGLPKNRYSVVFNTSYFRNTLQSIEFRHDNNYAKGNTANGPTTTATGCTAALCAGSGRADNAVTLLFDYYF